MSNQDSSNYFPKENTLQDFNLIPTHSIDNEYNESLTSLDVYISLNRTPRMTLNDDESINDNKKENNNQDNNLSERDTEPNSIKEKIESELQITNIAGTFEVGCQLNLKKILSLKNTMFIKGPFQVVQISLTKYGPKTIARIYSSGKIIVTGAKEEKLLKKAARSCAKKLKDIGYEVKFRNFEITNLSCSYDFGFPISLRHLSQALYEKLQNKYSKKIIKSSYEPHKYPGLIVKMKDPKLSCTIYKTGKCIIVGNTKKEHYQNFLEAINPFVKKNEMTNFISN